MGPQPGDPHDILGVLPFFGGSRNIMEYHVRGFCHILPASMKETHEIQLISGVILGRTSHPGGDSRFVPF